MSKTASILCEIFDFIGNSSSVQINYFTVKNDVKVST